MHLGLGFGRNFKLGEAAPPAITLYDMPGGAPDMLFWQQSFTGATDVSLSSGAVAQWSAHASDLGAPFAQGTGGNRPAWNTSTYEVTLDGSDDYLRRSEAPVYIASQSVPDAAYGTGNVAGQGFTITGLAYDSDDNVFLCGNHGKGVSSASSFDASLVIVSQSGATKINEIRMSALGLSAFGSMQGVAYDETRGQYMVLSQGEGKVHFITKNGTLATSFTHGGVLNGLARNADDDTYFIMTSYSGVTEYHSSDGTATGRSFSFTGMSDPDHICYHNGILYAVEGPNGSNLRMTYRVLSTGYQAPYVEIPGATAGEGIAVVGNRLYVANDGYFHGATPGGNKIMWFHFHQRAVSEFSLALYGKLDFAPTTNPAVLFSSGDTDTYGFEIRVSAGADDSIEAILHDGAASVATARIVLANDLMEECVLHVQMDFVAGTVSVLQDGAAQGVESFSGSPARSIALGALTLGADGDGENPAAMTIMGLYGYARTMDGANAAELSDYIHDCAASVVPLATWNDATFLAIATPHLWVEPFDTARFSGVTGNDFTGYTDKSANAAALTVSGSPKIGTRTIGGYNAFDLNAGARIIASSSPALAAVSAGDEWGFFFFQLDGGNTGINTLMKVTNSANSTRMTIGPFYGSNQVRFCRHSSGTVANTAWPGGVNTNVHVLTYAIVGTTMSIWIDGNLSGSGTATNITTTGGGLAFGARSDNGSEGMDGGLGPFALYSGIFSASVANNAVKYYLARMSTGITYTDIV